MTPTLPDDNIPIHTLGLSIRTENVLKRENITDFSELQKFTFQDLLKFKDFGKKCLKEVREKLNFYGLTLKNEECLYKCSDTILNSLPRMLEDLHYYIFNLQNELKIFEKQTSKIESFLKNVKKKANDTNTTR